MLRRDPLHRPFNHLLPTPRRPGCPQAQAGGPSIHGSPRRGRGPSNDGAPRPAQAGGPSIHESTQAALPLPPRKAVRSDYPQIVPAPRRLPSTVKSSPSAPAWQIRKPRLQTRRTSIHGSFLLHHNFSPYAPSLEARSYPRNPLPPSQIFVPIHADAPALHIPC
jgi:hypothetical protein